MLNQRRVQCGKLECKRLWTNERNLAYQRKHKAETGQYYSRTFTYERTCEGCGETWLATSKRARFCSVSCINKARRFEHTCEECGTTWVNASAASRHCSPECARASRFTKDVELWRPLPWWARHRVWVVQAPRRRWYAGRCRRCDASFVSDQPENRYCSRPCGRADAKARRRARKKNAYVSDVYRKKIFERDKWTCQLCHRKVNQRAVVPHPRAPVLDHIIPLNDDGTHEPANVQCAHFLCNSIKSDRGGGEQLLLIG